MLVKYWIFYHSDRGIETRVLDGGAVHFGERVETVNKANSDGETPLYWASRKGTWR